MESQTQTRTVSGTKLVIATALLLGAGGIAFAAAGMRSPATSNYVSVNSCQPMRDGVRITYSNGGTPVTLKNGCRDAGHGYRDYSLTCASRTKYKVSYVPCEDPNAAVVGMLSVGLQDSFGYTKNALLGKTGEAIAGFTLTADETEDIKVTSLAVIINSTANPSGELKNVRLMTEYGVAENVIPVLSDNDQNSLSGMQVIFTGVNVVVPKGESKPVWVVVDTSPFESGGVPGTNARASVENTLTGSPNIVAVGLTSGKQLPGDKIKYGPTFPMSQPTNFFRAFLRQAFASDSPEGTEVPGVGKIIAKINMSNTETYGGYKYDTVIRSMNIPLQQNGIENKGPRELRIYKGSVAPANLLTKQTYTGDFADMSAQFFKDEFITDDEFVDVTVKSGETVTFIVTLDTQDASTNGSLVVSLPSVLWTDGVATGTTVGKATYDAVLTKTLQY